MTSNQIKNVLNPVASQDVATKDYVDSAVFYSYAETGFSSNLTSTVISTMGVEVPVAGTGVAGLLNGFTTSVANLITYTSTPNITCKIEASWCWIIPTSPIPRLCHMVMKVNGTSVTKSTINVGLSDLNAGYPRNASMFFLQALSTSDTVQLFIANDEGTENILICDLQLTIVEV